MTLRMEIGHPVTNDVQPVEGRFIRFIAEDGRCMFEVVADSDGRSLEIRGVDLCKVNGRLYGSAICIHPHVSNSVRVAAVPYPEATP